MPSAGALASSALESAVLEANAVALGVPVDTLMENAGRAVAEEVAARIPAPPQRIVVLAGIGNNGGDGTAAAFYLDQWGYAPEVWLLKTPSEIRSPAARRCFDRIVPKVHPRIGVPSADELRGASILVDAMLGSGQSEELRAPYREAAEAVAASGVPVLAVDVPTGVGSASGIRPKWTVALTRAHPAVAPESFGELRVRDIGIPVAARERTGPGEFLLYPSHSPSEPRGRSARVVVVGGGPYTGAVALTGTACLRSGVERVTLVTPSPAAEAIAALSPDLVVHAVGQGAFAPTDVPRLLEILRPLRTEALVIGMGAGDSPATVTALGMFLDEVGAKYPLVVDADGLRALKPQPHRPHPLIATPNAGEYHRVFGGSADEDLAQTMARARDWGCTLLVKGAEDRITDGTEGFRNGHHHPAATVSGMGDVLGGVVGGLLAQGLSPLRAARLGAYWTGEAGHLTAATRGYGLVASDVVAELPTALVAGVRRVRELG